MVSSAYTGVGTKEAVVLLVYAGLMRALIALVSKLVDR